MFEFAKSPSPFRCMTAVAFALVTAAATPAFAGDRVVLVSWDGVRRDVLHSLLEYQPIGEIPQPCPHANHPAVMPSPCGEWLTCLPMLCNYFQLIDSNDVEGKPLTRPQHAQMLTGYGPAETGDITNSGQTGLPPGMTVYEHLRAARPEVKTVHIAGLKFIGRGIITNSILDGSLDLTMKRGGRDGYTGSGTTDQVAAGLDYIGDSPFFLFIHYKAADVIGHRASDKSNAYREAIINNDDQLGDVLTLLDAQGKLEGTKVFVTTDHGFNGNVHVNLENLSVSETWMASYHHDLRPEPGSILNITPTVLDAFGVDLNLAVPPYRGHSQLQH